MRAVQRATVRAHEHYLRLFEPEVDKDAPEIFVVFFNAVVELADMALIQEAQHSLLELATALAGNDFNERNLLCQCLLDNAIEFRINLSTAVVNVVQV